jgi:hypothetical protein
MQNILRFLARPTNEPPNPITKTPAMNVRIGPVYWRIEGFTFALSVLGAILATCFVCGLVGVLVRVVGLIG